MKNWLYGIISKLPSFLRKPLTWIVDRIWSVFWDALQFAKWIKYGIQKLRDAGRTFIRAVKYALDEIYATCKWLIQTYIPRLAKNAFDNAVKWARSAINTLNQTLRGIIAMVERVLKSAITTLKGWAEAAVRALTNSVNTLISNVKRLIDRVFGTWSTPTRLAEWLVGALWTVFLRFMYSNRDRIARWFLQSSAAFTQWMARELERVIARFL